MKNDENRVSVLIESEDGEVTTDGKRHTHDDVDITVKPCLAAAEKVVTCEYARGEPPNSCVAPHSVRCSQCLTF